MKKDNKDVGLEHADEILAALESGDRMTKEEVMAATGLPKATVMSELLTLRFTGKVVDVTENGVTYYSLSGRRHQPQGNKEDETVTFRMYGVNNTIPGDVFNYIRENKDKSGSLLKEEIDELFPDAGASLASVRRALTYLRASNKKDNGGERSEGEVAELRRKLAIKEQMVRDMTETLDVLREEAAEWMNKYKELRDEALPPGGFESSMGSEWLCIDEFVKVVRLYKRIWGGK